MCNLCDGTTYQEQLSSLRQRVDAFGWTSILVEPDERSLGWAYTIGLIGAGHPELVVLDEEPQTVARLFGTLAPQLLAGTRTLEPDSSFELAGRTWAVLSVDPSHIRTGLMPWWPKVLPHCHAHSRPEAIQLIDVDDLWSADSGARLDQRFEPSEERRLTRAQRRRRERAEAKRQGRS